ncbi:MAG: PEP-utilizing enzyme [Patescibacteria group bacterium]
MLTSQMLVDLRALLEGWGIKADDWYVTGEAAMVLSGYPVDYREGQMDVLVCRSSWPWEREEEQVSLFPDKGTAEDQQLNEFIAKHGVVPDFHPLPHVGIKAEDRFEQTYWHPDENGVRVLKPWAGVYHRKLIINFYLHESLKGLEVFDQAKFIRWKKFIEQIRDHAININDEKTITTCDEVLPIVQQAIDHFNTPLTVPFDKRGIFATGEEGESTHGTTAFAGKASGPVQHWQEGADFKGKVAFLTHMLPSQVTFIKDAVAIVTDQGGLLSHAATVAREYQIPTIIGTQNATSLFTDGELVEVDAEKGIVRRV